MARCTRAAATAESTPPDNPQMARPEPTCAADGGHGGVDDRRHRPGGLATAGLVEEALEHGLAFGGVHHLGVELHAVAGAGHVLEGGRRGFVGRGQHRGPLRRSGDRVEVAHPHGLLVGQAGQQPSGSAHPQGRAAVLAPTGGSHLASQVTGQQLGAIADAQNRHAQFVHVGVDAGGSVDVDRAGPAAEHDAGRGPGGDLGGGDRVGDDLAVDPGLAHPPGDQLGILGAEVDDQDRVLTAVAVAGPHVAGHRHEHGALSGAPSPHPGPAGGSCPRSGGPGPPSPRPSGTP